MPKKTISVGALRRSLEIRADDIDTESRTINLAFSSEAPVERWFGNEVLNHDAKSIRLGRMQNGGPLLMDHDHRDQIGVVESVTIDADKKARATVRFSQHSKRADQVFKEVQDGIRRHVSVGYRIHHMVLDEASGESETYRVDDWEPYEISLVSVPADPTVGVGRADDGETNTIIIETQEEKQMEKQTDEKRDQAKPVVTQSYNIDSESARVDSIRKLGELYDADEKFVRDFITSDKSPEQFRSALRAAMPPAPENKQRDADIGLTEKETQEFSFLRAITALANPTDRRAQAAAAFEFEVGAAAAAKQGRESRGIMVPNEVLKRDLSVGTATAGGHTVATDLLAANFIDLLRNRTEVFSRATQLTGLVGNIAIPRQTGGATGYWVAESASPTESQQAFDQVGMSPNTVGAFTDVSRKLLLQSSIDIEAFIRGDLARVLGIEIDRACINGSGSGSEPTGILNTTGIGSIVGGTNGLAPTWDHIVGLETEVAQDNADVGNLAYIVNSKVRGKAKRTFIDSGSGERLWDVRAGSTPLNGYQALTTNQVPSNLTKGTSSGVCSAIIFGNLADLIVGLWGGLDLMVDPYTSSTSGTVRVVALQDIDIAVRHAESFAAMKDALTV